MKERETNNLFPVFLKLEDMNVLIVGGGRVALEKLQAILSNAPKTTIQLVGVTICEEIKKLALNNSRITLCEREFLPGDLEGSQVIMVAINDRDDSARIRDLAKEKGKLVNVADKPALCDFYMCSVVRKGNLKMGISTNGKSPTIAKRLKEAFDEILPDEIDHLLHRMTAIRDRLKGDFAYKVRKLNALTEELSFKKTI